MKSKITRDSNRVQPRINRIPGVFISLELTEKSLGVCTVGNLHIEIPFIYV